MIELLYLAAASAFIVGLRRLSSPRTARSGNLLAALGMLIAVVVTLIDQEVLNWGLIAGGLIAGSLIGAVAARRVAMTSMPELVALLNGSGGAASALLAAAIVVEARGADLGAETAVSTAVSILIGAVTFSGSALAFAKLQGLVSGSPITYPGRQVVSAVLAASTIGFTVWAATTSDPVAFWGAAGSATLLGVAIVLPIGGGDMPVVVSLLNSFSGLAAAAAGFAIENVALIIGGALVGSAGLILTTQMSEAMNRSLLNVLFGAFGGDTTSGPTPGEGKAVNKATREDVAIALSYASSVLIVPGYGLAVAQAQHALNQLAAELERRGVQVRYAIHPVAGRMPGHMNVLLAEAEVPYEQLIDLEDANLMFPRTDAVLVVGANDVVNPAARDDATSPIYGMPILEVDRATTVIVIKRSLSPGFAGIDNPLFYDEKTLMFFADAADALAEVRTAFDTV